MDHHFILSATANSRKSDNDFKIKTKRKINQLGVASILESLFPFQQVCQDNPENPFSLFLSAFFLPFQFLIRPKSRSTENREDPILSLTFTRNPEKKEGKRTFHWNALRNDGSGSFWKASLLNPHTLASKLLFFLRLTRR